MERIIVVIGIALLLPLYAVAAPNSAKRVGATARMCQSYRIENGAAVKIGGPHACKDGKKLRVSLASLGGAVLPQ